MKIVSFDVGVKNLAYCIIERNANIDKIRKWGVINLVEKEQAILCDNEKCKKKAICSKIVKKQRTYYCKKHKSELKLKKVKKLQTTKISLLELNKRLISKLDEIKDFLEVDYVIIENQPVLKNPRMKSLQMMIYSYFVLRGIIDKEKTKSNILNIDLVFAGSKSKAYKGNTEFDIGTKGSKYIKRKKLSICQCREMIGEHNKNLLEFFNENKKKDDLSDSFLLGIYYLDKYYL